MDYCLQTRQKSHVLIEVKRAGESLVNHQEQLLRYSFAQGVPLAALTDGLIWWLYIPSGEGNWQNRKFFEVNFHTDSKEDASKNLMRFLGKTALTDGSALKEAQKEQQQKPAIGKIPKAWERLVSEPEELLVDLLREKVTELSGFEPSNKHVIDFLKGLVFQQDADSQNLPLESNKSKMPRSIKIAQRSQWNASAERVKVSSGYIDATGRKPKAFWLNEVRYEVRNWIEIVIRICGQKAEEVGDDFGEYVINIKGRTGGLYFSEDRDKVPEPQRIPNSNFFVSKRFSANGALDLAKRVVEAFYDSSDSFYIEFEK